MFHSVRRSLAALACLVPIATLGLPAPAAAALTPSWNGWKWARSGNLTITVGDNLSATWKPYLAPAAAAWSADPVIDLAPAAGRTNPSTCNPVMGTIQVCSGAYGFNGWLGYANVWLQNGYIVMGTVRLNDSYFASARYATDAWRQMTICQEIGHTLGLNHADIVKTNSNLGTCMDYTNDPTGVASNGPAANLAPYADDFASLAAIYATPGGVQLSQTRVLVAGSGYEIGDGDEHDHDHDDVAVAVPEPSTWMMLVAGFGISGTILRRRGTQVAASDA